MPTFFISDLHLSEKSPHLIEGFYDFLDNIANGADALYILGDFFDTWIGDDDDSAFAAAIKQKLSDYTSKGTAVYFTKGNRDFLVGNHFCRATNITLLEDLCVHDVYGTRILLMHGDTLCTRDTQYMQFRQMVRNDEWQAQVLSVPLAQRRMLAAELRANSLSMNSTKAEDIMDVTPSEASTAMNEYKVNVLVHGHTHRPKRHDMGDNKERIVLGDWGPNGYYLKACEKKTLELIQYPLYS